MVESENNEQEKEIKVPSVKRLKIPVVRPNAPVKAPMPQRRSQVPSEPPLDDDEDIPASNAPQSAVAEPAHEKTQEPDLPPENKTEVVSSPIEAEEIEKKTPPKRRRPANRANEQEEKERREAQKAREKQIREAKQKVEKVWGNKIVKLSVIGLLVVILGFTTYSFLPVLVEKKMPELFASNGIPLSRFTLKSVTMEEMTLTNVSDSSRSITISSMTLKYKFLDLLTKGHVQSLDLAGVNLKGVKKGDSFSLGAFGDLVTSPFSKGEKTPLIIESFKISKGRFSLVDESSEERKDPMVVGFKTTGSLMEKGLTLDISTDYKTPTMVVEAKTVLEKTAMSSQIKTNITKGDLLKEGQNVGSVTGNLDVSVDNGVLTKGDADLLLASSSQELKLKASVIPLGKGFDVNLDLNRSFQNKEEAVGKFVGDISLIAKNLTVSGDSKAFNGNLPLTFVSQNLTNGSVVVNDLKTDLNVNFACQKSDCKASLTKPMTLGFNNLLYTGKFKKFRFFKPITLTINPNPQKPFLVSDSSSLSFVLPITGLSTQIFVSDSSSNLQLAMALNALNSELKYNIFSGKFSSNFAFSQSGIATKDAQFAGVTGTASLSSDGLPSLNVRIPKITMAKKDILPDFAADVSFKPMGKNEFSIQSTVSIQNGLLTSTLTGSYGLRSKEWKLFVVVPKFVLSDTDLNMESSLPFLKKYLPPSTRGVMAAKGRVTIKNGSVKGPLKVLFEKMQMTKGNFSAKEINGVVEFSSLKPFETPANQQLFVGELGIGVPFRNALFNYRVVADKGIEVANARMMYADGQFKTIKSFLLPYEGESDSILFQGAGINLSALSNNLKSRAFNADGEVDSQWTLSIKNKKLMIDEALFQSKLPGMLQFDTPDSLKTKIPVELQSFLKSVIVKDLSLKANGDMLGSIKFDVFIKGHGPLETEEQNRDVTFDFQSTLKSLFKQEVKPVSIPSDILLSFQEYEK